MYWNSKRNPYHVKVRKAERKLEALNKKLRKYKTILEEVYLEKFACEREFKEVKEERKQAYIRYLEDTTIERG